MCDAGGIDRITIAECCRLLAEADRHLRNRAEEKELRRKMKALLAGGQLDSERQQTVDVLALRRGQ
jgi:hypothetical protein